MLKIRRLHQELGAWLRLQRLQSNLTEDVAAHSLGMDLERLQKCESGMAVIGGIEFFNMIRLYETNATEVISFLTQFRIKAKEALK